MEFPTKGRLERHLKEQHSDFSYKRTVCKKLFNRRNLQHDCKDITNVDMLLFSRDGKKGGEAVKEYKKYETEIMPTHMIRVRKGDKKELER